MFLPFGDYPNPPKPQWATRILIGINVAIFLLVTLPLSKQALRPEDWRNPANRAALDEMLQLDGAGYDLVDARPAMRDAWMGKVSRYRLFTQKYGYKPARPSVLALLLCMFLHGGFWHIAGNMLYLYIFGDNVEWRLGRVGYLAAYLATGIVATLSFAAFAGDSFVPLIGASGAISGVLGFYLLWFPRNQVRVLVFFFFILIVHVRAIWVLGAYLVLDNLVPFLLEQSGGPASGVARGAHIGGFLAGMTGAWVINRVRGALPAPRPGPHVERRRAPWVRGESRDVDTRALFHKAVREGDMKEAAHQFSRHVQQDGAPPHPDSVFALARWLYDGGYAPDAAAVFRYYLSRYPNGPDLDRVHFGLGALLARRLAQPAAAREHLLQAIELSADASVQESARTILADL